MWQNKKQFRSNYEKLQIHLEPMQREHRYEWNLLVPKATLKFAKLVMPIFMILIIVSETVTWFSAETEYSIAVPVLAETCVVNLQFLLFLDI